MYLRFKDLSGMGGPFTSTFSAVSAQNAAYGDEPEAVDGWAGWGGGGGVEQQKTLLVAPTSSGGGSYGGTSSGGKDAGSLPGGLIPPSGPTTPPKVATLPPGGGAPQPTGCQRYADPRVNEAARVKALNNASNYYQKMISNAQTATRATNLCQNPETRNRLVELAKDLQAQAKAGTEYFNKALNAKCAGDAEDAASVLQGMMAKSDSTYNLADGIARGGCTAPAGTEKKGGSLAVASGSSGSSYDQQSNDGDWGSGGFFDTPLPSFDVGGGGFDNWGGGGYVSDPGFDQFTDGGAGGDGLSLDYTSGGDQMPGDTFGAPEIEIPQDQGIDLNLPTGNEGGIIQGKKFPWWLLLVGGAVLALSNDGKGKKKGKR